MEMKKKKSKVILTSYVNEVGKKVRGMIFTQQEVDDEVAQKGANAIMQVVQSGQEKVISFKALHKGITLAEAEDANCICVDEKASVKIFFSRNPIEIGAPLKGEEFDNISLRFVKGKILNVRKLKNVSDDIAIIDGYDNVYIVIRGPQF